MEEPRTVAGRAAVSALRPHVRRAISQTIVDIEHEAEAGAVRPAVLVIVRHGGRVLLARHRYYPTDIPVLIAGMIEPGESAEEAAVREVAEETGLSVTLDAVLGTYPFETDGKRLLMIGVVASAASSSLALDDELTDAAWYELDDLPSWPAEWPIHAVFAAYRRMAQSVQDGGREP